jgi:hypothetical protein
MQPRIAAALEHVGSLEARSRELIRVKLVHFAPNRGVLRALLSLDLGTARMHAPAFALQSANRGDP